MLSLFVCIFELDIEHLREVLSQSVRGGSLDATTTDRHVQLHCSRVNSTGKSFVFRLATTHDGAGQEIFVNFGIHLLHLVLENGGLFFGSVGCMALLPEELSCSDEGGWVLELPSDDIGPLVEEQWEVSMGSDPLCIGWVHNGL